MDMLKNITGGGADKPKVEVTKPSLVDNAKAGAASAQTAVTGAATNAGETAKGFGAAGQEAVGNAVTSTQEYLSKPSEPAVIAPTKKEGSDVAGGLFK